MLYRVTHTTTYTYPQPVAKSVNEARLTPRDLPWQFLRSSSLDVSPEPANIAARTDYFGNRVTTISIFEPHDLLTVRASSIVEVTPRQEALGLSLSWEETREMLAAQADDECLAAYEFACDSPFVIRGLELAEYARPTFTPGRPLLDALLELMARIRSEFRYEPKSTTIDTPVLEVLQKRAGVCQDFAHLMIGALRSLGLAARYVSGYLRSGENYHGSEASHAWVAAFVPGTGWVHFDPTNSIMPSDGHVTIGWGRDYGDVTPLRGITRGGGQEAIEVEVRVTPLDA